MDRAHGSINGKMDEQIVVYLCNEILFSHEKEKITEALEQYDPKLYAEEKNSHLKIYAVCVHLYEVLEEAKLIYGGKNIRTNVASKGCGCWV